MTEDIVMPENGGVRIGKDSFKYILLQVHWNNEGALNNQTGMSILVDQFDNNSVL